MSFSQVPSPDLASVIDRFSGAKLWVIGDLMLDEYVQGEVSRISPEAPVPVIAVEKTWSRLGGAANVAHCLAMLGASVQLCGVIGPDSTGDTLIAACHHAQINTNAVARPLGHSTPRKVRLVARHQQLLRMDWEKPAPIDDSLFERLLGILVDSGPPQAIVLSDYGKGVLTKATIARLIALGRSLGVPVLVDPKHRDLSVYAGATVVTPNQNEFSDMADMAAEPLPDTASEEYVDLVRSLGKQAGVDALVVTLGERGLVLVPADGPAHRIRATSRDVYDVTGAGDTLIAALALSLTTGADLVTAARIANAAAGVVVGKFGTAFVGPDELSGALGANAADLQYTATSLDARLAIWREQGQRIVFTNGCFDLLHAGHLSLLRFAASLGDVLIVGLNDDASVRRLKGTDRPLVSQSERAALVAALECVGAVALFGEDTPLDLITRVKPDVLVKGADYKVEDVVGREIVEANGGQVVLAPLVPGRSSTNLLNKVRASAK